MESIPSTSRMSPSKKHKRLNLYHLSVCEKQNIINLYKKFMSAVPKLKITAIVQKIASIEGIAKSTVYRTIKEYKENGNVTESKRSGGRRKQTFDDSIKKLLMQIVHNFILKNEVPTLNKVFNEIESRQDVPQMSRSSLYNLMKKIRFKKNDGNGGDHILSRKRKGAEDVNSIKSEQKLRKSNRINNRIAPIEEIMIKVEPSDEPVEEVFINPEQIKEPGMEIAVKEEPIGESVEEIVIKEEHIDDYPVYSQVYKHIQLQIKSEEDDEEKYQIPGQSS